MNPLRCKCYQLRQGLHYCVYGTKQQLRHKKTLYFESKPLVCVGRFPNPRMPFQSVHFPNGRLVLLHGPICSGPHFSNSVRDRDTQIGTCILDTKAHRPAYTDTHMSKYIRICLRVSVRICPRVTVRI